MEWKNVTHSESSSVMNNNNGYNDSDNNNKHVQSLLGKINQVYRYYLINWISVGKNYSLG